MNPSQPQAGRYASRIQTGTRQLYSWSGAWAGSCLLIGFGPEFVWHQVLVFTLLALGLNVCAGIGLIVVHKKFLMDLDELQRKIIFNAMGITLGVALVSGVPYSVMGAFHVIPFHADISHLVVLMSLTYVASTVYGYRRYR